MNKFIFCLLLVIPIQINAETYKRNELLQEGKRSLNTINEYNILKKEIEPWMKTNLIDVNLYLTQIFNFQVDTLKGKDKVTAQMLHINIRIPDIYNLFSFYTMFHGFFLESASRNTTGYHYDETSKTMEKNAVKYGSVIEGLIGLELYYKNLIKFSANLLITKYELYNVDFIYEPIDDYELNDEGILVDAEGNYIYKNYKEDEKTNFSPIISISIFESIETNIHISTLSDKIDSTESSIIYNFTDSNSQLLFTHIYYDYWDKDNGILLAYEKFLDKFDFGTEYLVNNNIISQCFVKIKYPFIQSDGVYLLSSLKLNIARTPETIIANDSKKFLFGGKFDIKYALLNIVEETAGYISIYLLYNNYDELKILRGAADKFGFGSSFRAFY